MFQGWRPPGASTAIRPSRVVGWPAPIATLVNLLKKYRLLVRCQYEFLREFFLTGLSG
jgi:hypothetical protein